MSYRLASGPEIKRLLVLEKKRLFSEIKRIDLVLMSLGLLDEQVKDVRRRVGKGGPTMADCMESALKGGVMLKVNDLIAVLPKHGYKTKAQPSSWGSMVAQVVRENPKRFERNVDGFYRVRKQ